MRQGHEQPARKYIAPSPDVEGSRSSPSSERGDPGSELRPKEGRVFKSLRLAGCGGAVTGGVNHHSSACCMPAHVQVLPSALPC